MTGLDLWPRELGGALTPLTGGFSGARLWRVGGERVLRGEATDQVEARHRWMRTARDAGLAFVPALLPCRDGRTWGHAGGLVWEMQSWMPGVADYHARPSVVKLRAACEALAALHAVWRCEPIVGPPPAVLRRLAAIGEGDFRRQLAPYADAAMALHPCLVDVWHDHVLFTGDAVTGVVDYAAMRPDVPHADLARLLGSLIEDDDDGWAAGLEAYGPIDERLTRLLDRSGTWVAWRLWERRASEGRVGSAAARARLERLRRRVAAWGGSR